MSDNAETPFEVKELISLKSGHKKDVTSCAFAKELLVTASTDCTVRVWNVGERDCEEKPFSPLKSHSYSVNDTACSSEGTFFVTGSTDGTCNLHESESGNLLHTFVQPSGNAVRSCHVSQDSRFLAAAGDDNDITIYDVEQRTVIKTLKGHLDSIYSICFTPDSSYLVSTDILGIVSVWFVAEVGSKLLHTKEEVHDLGIYACDVSLATGDKHERGVRSHYILGSGGNDNMVKIHHLVIDSRTRLETKLVLKGHEEAVYAVKFSPGGKYLASAGGDKQTRLWDTSNGACLAVLSGHTRYVTSCHFSKSGRLLASAGNDKVVKIWTLPSDQVLSNASADPLEAELQNYRRKAREAGGSQAKPGLSTRKPMQCKAEVKAHDGDVSAIAVTSDNELYTGGGDKKIKIWRRSERGEFTIVKELKIHVYPVTCMETNGKRELVLTGSIDGYAKVIQAKDQTVINTLTHSSAIRSCALSENNNRAATGGDDHNIKIWDIHEGHKLSLLAGGHTEVVNTLNFIDISSSFSLVVSGCRDGELRLWDLESTGKNCKPKEQRRTVKECLTCTAVSPLPLDGYVVVLSGDQEGKIDAWRYSEDNKATLLPWKSLKAHGSAVLSMNFDTGGSRFVSVSEDKIIRLWQTSSCDCLYSVIGHNRYISRVVFTPNSKELVTGSNDRTFKVWQIEDLVQANTSRKVDDWSKGDVQSWLVKNIEGKTEQTDLNLNPQELLAIKVPEAQAKFKLTMTSAIFLVEKIQQLRHANATQPQDDDDDDDVPNEFLCPITQEIMMNPVTCSDGFTYEEAAIREWTKTRRSTSPMTNLPIKTEFVLNQELKQKILDFVRANNS